MIGMLPLLRGSRREGFTLVEVLAALAIGSVIIVSTAALTWNVGFYFDRGTRGVTELERLILASKRLAADIGSARYIQQPSSAGVVTTFTAGPANIVYVTGGGMASGPQQDEIVALTVEDGDNGATRLVRRRAPWLGVPASLDAKRLGDQVVLIEGNFDIAFAFGQLGRDGVLSWSDKWTEQPTLPQFIRVMLHDRKTGVDVLAGAEFTIHADAPRACAEANATIECLAGGAAGRKNSPPSSKGLQ